MGVDAKKLEIEAGRLPVKERARLIRRLIATLETEDDGNLEQAWLDEAERRLSSHRRADSGSREGDKVFDEVLNRLDARLSSR